MSKKFTGPEHFRQRIVCAVLSSQPVTITGIRDKEEVPGVKGRNAARILGVRVLVWPVFTSLLLHRL
jgi:RNA 3'-terminal phosphate cyclase